MSYVAIVAATGHRPDKLGGWSDQGHAMDSVIRERLMSLAHMHLLATNPARVISGMALGWDQVWCQAALEAGVRVYAAVPFNGQEAKWRPDSRAFYRRLLERVEMAG